MWGRIAAMFENAITSPEKTFELRSLKGRVSSESYLRNHVEAWGAECFIITDPRDPTRVYGTTWEPLPAVEAKRIFYKNRILHTLFPKHFPKIHRARGIVSKKQSEHWTGTIREKIIPTPHKRGDGDVFALVVGGGFKHFFDDHLNYDDSERNFIEDEKRNRYYVDTYIEARVFKRCTEKELAAIVARLEKTHPPEAVRRVVSSLRRLHELQ